MEKIVMALMALFLLIQSSFALETFCGWSTYGFCLRDSDCQAGGCSGQVCERKGEETITTCEWKDCYRAEDYNLTCQCINNQCQWGYQDKTPFAKQESKLASFKSIFYGLITINPIILLVLGIILILVAKLAKFVGIVLIILAIIALILWLV
jgi:eight-cysteine-cluster-containing protein